jgi:hypothetical protein
MSITPERAHWLKNIHLTKGYHRAKTPGEWCLMEAAAYIAGESWTDHPKCVSPVLTSYGVALNDSWDDDQRQKLIPFIPRLLGTVGDGQDKARSYLAIDWLLRTYTSTWVHLAGLTAEASALREHTRIVDVPGVESIQTALLAAQATLSPMYSVAREATLPPMYSAAYSATRLVTYSEPQAHFAVRLAASVATASAAVSAAFRTDHLVAQDALAPTVKMLQASALDLLDAMIDPGLAAQENV